MRRLPAEAYIEGVLTSDRVRLSQAITLIESKLPADRELAQQVMAAIMPHTGKAFRLGITGVPGVGKSTFINAFGGTLTQKGYKLAVLAIDPSSQRTRGSILGDKTRMDTLASDANAYIRPSPAGDSLGGVARKTREAMLLCEAAGYDFIIVETVGVGQSETAVRSMTDMFLLLMLPNAGDELQGIKKGIMEMADAIVINKADGNFEQKAKLAKAHYAQALHLFPPKPSGWHPPVLLASALQHIGLTEIADMLAEYEAALRQNTYWAQQRREQHLSWLHEAVQHHLSERFYQHPDVAAQLPTIEKDVIQGIVSPIQAAEALLKAFFAG